MINVKEKQKIVQTNAGYKQIIAEIKEQADNYLQTIERPLSFHTFKQFHDTGSRLEYEELYFEKRKRLNAFALMSFIEPSEEKYFAELEQMIWSICNEHTWCLPAHYSIQAYANIDLFAAETAFTMAELLYVFDGRLHPIIQQQIRNEVNRRVLTPFQRERFAWETWTHNWASVCAGSVGAAALYLIEDEKILSDIIDRVLASMNAYISGFHDDGTCLEGYGYWEYGFGYFIYFADLLKRKTNGNIDLFTKEKVKHIALFQQKVFLHNGNIANFSDSQAASTIFLGISHYLHRLYPEFTVPKKALAKPFHEDHCGRWAPAFRNLIWYEPEKIGSDWERGSVYLSESSWYIKRTDHYSFATKGGDNDEPHNHNDLGHFILQIGDEVFFQDLGAGMYNKKYFSDERYTFLCTSSYGHSVPILNGEGQQAGKEYRAEMREIDEKTVEINLTNAYRIDGLINVTRRFRFEGKIIYLEDSYESLKNIVIIERLIVPLLEVQVEKDTIILQGSHTIRMHYDSSQLQFTYEEASYTNHFGKEEHCLLLNFERKEQTMSCKMNFEIHIE